MLRNNADARRCSYFELGLPVLPCTCEARESLSPVSLSVFSLAPDFSLDLSHVLNCEKILTVLSVKAYKRPLRSVGGS